MKVIRNKNNTVTIENINASLLSSILTEAALGYYDAIKRYRSRDVPANEKSLKEYEKQGDLGMASVVKRNMALSDNWFKGLKAGIDELETGLRQAFK